MDSVTLQYVQLKVHLTTLSFFQVIKQFVKGVFNVKPPIPHCTFTWDIRKVLSYMDQLTFNKEMSLRFLSEKTAMILLLLGSERINSLTAFLVESIQMTTTECTFIPCKL